MINPAEFHVTATSSADSAVELLCDVSDLSKSAVKAAMTKGAVWITRGNRSQRLRRATRTLQADDQIHLYFDPRVLAESPPAATLISDSGEYSVWCKPRGMRSQGSKWGDHCTVMRWAEQHLTPERSSYTVHRLDLATSGLILIAHSKTMAAALAKLFRDREVIKHYRAVVHGQFGGRNDDEYAPTMINTEIDGKTACSEVTLVERSAGGERSLVNVQIHTGRKHQIRQHLAGVGHPVVGDRLYGTGVADGVDLQLTAWFLSFLCPIRSQPVEFVLPEELHCYSWPSDT